MKRILTTITVAVGASLLLAACAAEGGPETADATEAASEPAPSSAMPSPTPTPTHEAAPLSESALATVFTDVMFVPDEFETTADLLDSVYPGLTVSDRACLAPFGADWESAVSADGGSIEFGTSKDRSMTAALVSAADSATSTELLAQAEDALTRCATGDDLFALNGTPVTTTVEPIDLTLDEADESLEWQVSGDVGGAPFTLVGATVRVGDDVLAVVGWDPSTNSDYVPLAAQAFMDELAKAHG